MSGTSRKSFDGWFKPWAAVAAILILGTSLCAVTEALVLDKLIARPTVNGGSITTLLPAHAYASATVMKVCLAGGLIAGAIAIAGWLFPLGHSTPMSRGPRYGIVSAALPPLTLILGTITILVAQALVDVPPGSPADFQRFGRIGVFVMSGGLVAGVALALIALRRGERPRTLAIFGAIVNSLLLILFWSLRFYAQHFDQDRWASAFLRGMSRG
jgi:hypothetical protein